MDNDFLCVFRGLWKPAWIFTSSLILFFITLRKFGWSLFSWIKETLPPSPVIPMWPSTPLPPQSPISHFYFSGSNLNLIPQGYFRSDNHQYQNFWWGWWAMEESNIVVWCHNLFRNVSLDVPTFQLLSATLSSRHRPVGYSSSSAGFSCILDGSSLPLTLCILWFFSSQHCLPWP